ncbi:hypothetical protein BCR43DRAFT_487080 [Syncephalastrum racemosum]|uniref:Mediator complex subunit 8 n=1 Tax=Syncephalastrum racemosum TaxID=13706 RepID=A0A1X2HQB0_SYNRA|nr:hypothetical protein BCR43DRAFT_487080 [Syncephalastrum racemosum]
MDLQRNAHVGLDPNTIQELETLRGKLWSLQETFAAQIAYLKEPKYPFTWPDLLNKFNMLTAKFASLSDDFYGYIETGSNATLPKLMLHPFIPTTTEQETNISSVLLRTKLIPDIERLELETQAAVARELSSHTTDHHHHHHHHHNNNNINNNNDTNNNNNGAEDDEQLIRSHYEQWTSHKQRHDRIAVDAANFVADLVNDYREDFLLRIEDQEAQEKEENEDEEDRDRAEDKAKPEEQEEGDEAWEKMGFPNKETWRRWKLECLVNLYSSGKDEVPGSDLKKMATRPAY